MGLFSFGRDRTTSSSQSESAASSRTTQDVFLADLFSSLYSGAAGEAAGIDTAAVTRMANDLFQTGSGFIDSLEGAGSPGFIADPVSVGGVAPVSVSSNAADEIAMLQSDLGNLFREELQPAISSTAIAGRGLGGGRQGVAEGEAIGRLGREFVRGRNDIVGRDIDRTLTADLANQQASLQSLGLGLEADTFNANLGTTADLQSRGLTIDAATRALSALPTQAGIGQLGAGAGLDPYMMLAQIYGAPTVLTESESESACR